MPLRCVIAAVVLIAGVGMQQAYANPDKSAAGRVVSLDYCADQYVLQFVAAENILALSPEANQEFSYLRNKAHGFQTVRPIIEDVLSLGPDTVVRSYGGGYGIENMLGKLGVTVVQIGYANTLPQVRQSVLSVSAALGASESGRKMIARMDERLQAISDNTDQNNTPALYMTPTGVTAGPGTLMHDMLLAAGLKNFEERPGWHALPLEKLVYNRPEVVAQAFYQSIYGHRDLWSAAAHPVTRQQLALAHHVQLQGAWTSCGAWFLMDAIETLHLATSAGGQIDSAVKTRR